MVDVDVGPRSWPALTTLERCDGCGARARARALLAPTSGRPGHAVLLFCGHHLREHGPRLVEQGGLLVVLPDDIDAIELVPQPRVAGATRH
jgi:hypothetical protein